MSYPKILTIQDISCVGQCSLTVALPILSACGLETCVLPSAVLSGGQYDKLMQKLGRKAGAMGFAVYTDMLERLEKEENSLDVDIVLIYDESATVAQIAKQVNRLTAEGNRVLALPNIPAGMRYGKLLKLNASEVETCEENA